MSFLLAISALAGSLTIVIFYAALTFCLKMKKSRPALLVPLMIYLTVLSFIKMFIYESDLTIIPVLLCNVVLIYYIAHYSASSFTETLITGVSGILFCLIFPDIICSVLVRLFFDGVFDRNPNHIGTTASILATNSLAICFSVLFCFLFHRIKKAKKSPFLLFAFFFLTLLFLSQEVAVFFLVSNTGDSSSLAIAFAALLFCVENLLLAYFLLNELEKFRKEQLRFRMESAASESTFLVDKQELTSREMSKLRHDLKNQMSTVQILLTNNRTENAAELAAEILAQFEKDHTA